MNSETQSSHETTAGTVTAHDDSSHPDTARRAELQAALEGIRANPRVTRITVAVSHDACPAGRDIQATYPKDVTPLIPLESCSRPQGCNCRYLPVLDEIFP